MNRMIANLAALALAITFPVSALAQDDAEGQSLSAAEAAEAAIGQDPGASAAGAPQAAVQTQLTSRSHQIGAFSSANFLEGNACPAGFAMVSGACHPGFNDRVIIINQFPNVTANTWRCGFRNNNGTSRTVWIYTLCGK